MALSLQERGGGGGWVQNYLMYIGANQLAVFPSNVRFDWLKVLHSRAAFVRTYRLRCRKLIITDNFFLSEVNF